LIGIANPAAYVSRLWGFERRPAGAELTAQPATVTGGIIRHSGIARRGEPARLFTQSEAGHLSLSGGRAFASGDLSPQAETRRTKRQADARVFHQGPADCATPGQEAYLLWSAARF